MQKVDYEQLYYDVLYENKILRHKIECLEQDLMLIKKSDKKKINLKKEILKEINQFYRKKGENELGR